MSDQETLLELIDRHRLGRPWEDLGRALGVSGATVRGWAAGRHPIKPYRAEALATYLGVERQAVLDAAAESQRRQLDDVGDDPYPARSANGGALGVGGLAVDERTEIGEVARLLAEAAERLARIAEREPDEG